MGVADFAAGWALGAKTGNQGFEEFMEAAKAVAASKEFKDMVSAARSHVGFSLRQLGDILVADSKEPVGEDLLDMVRNLVGIREPTLAAWFPWEPRPRPPAS